MKHVAVQDKWVFMNSWLARSKVIQGQISGFPKCLLRSPNSEAIEYGFKRSSGAASWKTLLVWCAVLLFSLDGRLSNLKPETFFPYRYGIERSRILIWYMYLPDLINLV